MPKDYLVKTLTGVATMRFYRSRHSDLLRDTVPIKFNRGGPGRLPPQWFPVHRIILHNIAKRELIYVSGEIEVTIEVKYRVSCAMRFVLNASYNDRPAGTLPRPTKGATFISAGGGPNVLLDIQHHELLKRSCIFSPDRDYGKRNITMMLKCESDGAPGTDVVTLISAASVLEVVRFS
jgi:hypothetical protein